MLLIHQIKLKLKINSIKNDVILWLQNRGGRPLHKDQDLINSNSQPLKAHTHTNKMVCLSLMDE